MMAWCRMTGTIGRMVELNGPKQIDGPLGRGRGNSDCRDHIDYMNIFQRDKECGSLVQLHRKTIAIVLVHKGKSIALCGGAPLLELPCFAGKR